MHDPSMTTDDKIEHGYCFCLTGCSEELHTDCEGVEPSEVRGRRAGRNSHTDEAGSTEYKLQPRQGSSQDTGAVGGGEDLE